jgi:hypothetical protein
MMTGDMLVTGRLMTGRLGENWWVPMHHFLIIVCEAAPLFFIVLAWLRKI